MSEFRDIHVTRRLIVTGETSPEILDAVAGALGLSPDAQKAIDDTLAFCSYVSELAFDGFYNKRGGTDENHDVPRPAPPDSPHLAYIMLRYFQSSTSNRPART